MGLLISEIILRIFNVVDMKSYFLPQGLFKADKDFEYVLTPNFGGRHQTKEFNYEIIINSLGLFDEEYNGEQPTILIAGDSFAFGYVPIKYRWTELLEKSLGVRVVNTGVIGYGNYQELLMVKKFAPIVKPKLIILGYFHNDPLEDYTYPGRTVINGYLADTKEINFDTGEIKEKPATLLNEKLEDRNRFVMMIKTWLRRNSTIYVFVIDKVKSGLRGLLSKIGITETSKNITDEKDNNYIIALTNSKENWIEKGYELNYKHIKEIQTYAEQIGASFLMVIIPDVMEIYPQKWQHWYSQTIRYLFLDIRLPNRRITNFCKKENISCLDLLPYFEKEANKDKRKLDKDDFYYNEDRHWNIRGNQFAASVITEFIIKNNLLTN